MPQPLKLTPEIQRTISRLIRAGNAAEVAAGAAGISRSSFFAWMQKGRDDDSGRYRAFREAIERARVEAEGSLVGQAAGWKAATWMLERSRPERWGPLPVRRKSRSAWR